MIILKISLLLAFTSSSLGVPPSRLGEGESTEQRRMGYSGPWREGVRDRQMEMLFEEQADINSLGDASIPPQFDWRTFGVISPVKNQQALGSSVAITAEECVESLNAILQGQLVSLSPSEVQDCCTGLTDNVFTCIANIGGLCGASSYPAPTGVCSNSSCQPEVKIVAGVSVPANQVMDMVEALLLRPLLVSIDASQTSFQTYSSGIYSDPSCSRDQVDHAMQLVGYGVEDGQEYWICKNSFGESWGELGYIRITKGINMCGIETFASYPV